MEFLDRLEFLDRTEFLDRLEFLDRDTLRYICPIKVVVVVGGWGFWIIESALARFEISFEIGDLTTLRYS